MIHNLDPWFRGPPALGTTPQLPEGQTLVHREKRAGGKAAKETTSKQSPDQISLPGGWGA